MTFISFDIHAHLTTGTLMNALVAFLDKKKLTLPVAFGLPFLIGFTVFPWAITHGHIFLGIVVFLASLFGGMALGFKGVSGMLKPQDIPNGVPATATIQSVRQGGMKIKMGVSEFYQLMLDAQIRNEGGETWTATIKQMVPITQIGMFQPGQSIVVKYDPNDRTKVVVDGSQASANAVITPGADAIPKDVFLQLQATNALAQELRVTGVSCQAEIQESTKEYGGYLNQGDVWRLRIRVLATTIEPYDATILVLVGMASAYKMAAGNTIYVRYDPNAPHRVTMTGTDAPNTGYDVNVTTRA